MPAEPQSAQSGTLFPHSVNNRLTKADAAGRPDRCNFIELSERRLIDGA
jgi:hypothetical protein